MHFSSLFAGVAAAATIGQATAVSVAHRGHHHHHHHHAAEPTEEVRIPAHRLAHLKAPEAGIAERSVHITETATSKLRQMGVPVDGKNDVSDNGGVWIGEGGDVTNTFINHSGEHIILVVWSEPWITDAANQPWVTMSMEPGCERMVSFKYGASGAWSAIHPGTNLDMAGMIHNTWGEFTMDPSWGTLDVSREVNMHGSHMRIETPICVTDMETCVFVCDEGAANCWQKYHLKNCANGSQQGASLGTYDGADSGGCMMGSSKSLKTILGKGL